VLISVIAKLSRPRPPSNGPLRTMQRRSTWPILQHCALMLAPRVGYSHFHNTAGANTSKAAWKNMANVYVNTCSDTAPGQNWTVMADGRIAVTASAGTRKPCSKIHSRNTHKLMTLQSNASISNTCEPHRTTPWACTTALDWATPARRTRVSTGH
jgi:hypothetical protein